MEEKKMKFPNWNSAVWITTFILLGICIGSLLTSVTFVQTAIVSGLCLVIWLIVWGMLGDL
jgi:ACR3 family arsenite efflux pump ArsB